MSGNMHVLEVNRIIQKKYVINTKSFVLSSFVKYLGAILDKALRIWTKAEEPLPQSGATTLNSLMAAHKYYPPYTSIP